MPLPAFSSWRLVSNLARAASFAKLAAQDLSPPPVVIVLRTILRVSVGSFALLSPSPESAKETLP